MIECPNRLIPGLMEPSGLLFVETDGVVMIGMLSVKVLQAGDDAVDESKGGSLLIIVCNDDVDGPCNCVGDVCFCWIRLLEATGVITVVVDSSEAL